MPGESITHLIFFIAAIFIAVGVIGVVTTNVQSITASYGMGSKTLADQLKTDITIINDPAVIPYIINNYSFFVKNTGKSTIDPTTVNMFIDGNYTNVINKWTVMEGGTMWYPTSVLRLNYTTTTQFTAGDHTVRVVAGNGVFDTMPFRR
ncbi:MAG: flagellar protein G [Euryarchaeota archaeon]|nr:flagellar protein G [Euryarchaeota archaeon]MBU4220768.1 flagellar protein G [Euryarchaeota archaeon]